MNGVLTMWVVYKNPSDIPPPPFGQDVFVVRAWEIGPNQLQPAPDPHWVGNSLREARESLPAIGTLVQMERALEDDPAIVETWF